MLLSVSLCARNLQYTAPICSVYTRTNKTKQGSQGMCVNKSVMVVLFCIHRTIGFEAIDKVGLLESDSVAPLIWFAVICFIICFS
jgi:hypothetical protein